MNGSIKEKCKELKTIIMTETFEGKRKEQNLRLLIIASCALGVVASIMTVLNLMNQNYFMAATTIGFVLGFALCIYFCAVKKDRNLTVILAGTMISVLLTIYLITGENEGFAALWILIIPTLVQYFLGLKWGLMMSVYFLILQILMFYTPLRHIVEEHYTTVFMLRFPILYLGSMVVAILFGLQNHVIQLKQNNYEKEL